MRIQTRQTEGKKVISGLKLRKGNGVIGHGDTYPGPRTAAFFRHGAANNTRRRLAKSR